jgi:tetratricopeptide (TPR) repeat protein
MTLIQRWNAEGREQGDPRELPPPPHWESGWDLGQPDVVLTLPAAYVLKSDGPDVFRTFVVSVPIAGPRYVRALEFDPGNARAIHHANLKVDATRSSRSLDEQEPGPGYEGAGALGAKFPDGYFLGWTPGQSPLIAPKDLSWRLDAPSDLVIELHMTPTGRTEHVRPRVALYFTDQAPARRPYMIRLGRQDIDIPAGDDSYVTTDTYVLPVDAHVIAVQPHAHWLAKSMRGVAIFPDGRKKWLISISDWDMRWQEVYRLREPLHVPKGTRLTMSYTYDNSSKNVRNPFNPPRRVTFGQASSSEMGDLWLQVMTATEEDRTLLDRDFAPKMLREDIAGIEKMIESRPRDPRLHADLGWCYLEAGRKADGLYHLEEAARLDPASAGAQHDVGLLLLQERRFEEARVYFDAAIRLKPDFAEAYNNRGAVNHAQGRIAEAVPFYEKAIALDPMNAEAEYNMARAALALGQSDAALAHYRRSIDIDPNDPVTAASLASLLASRGEIDEALAFYRRALTVDPDLSAALVDLAWILATSEREDVRAPREAVRLAEHADRLADFKSATVADTLATAYAAAGETGQAIANAERAIALASASGPRELVLRIKARLELYRSQQ